MKLRLLVIGVFLWSMVIAVHIAMAAEYIWTDEPQYLKGDTAQIFGTNFTPYTSVVIKVTRPDGSVVKGDGTETAGCDTVVTNVDGNLAYFYFINGIQAEGTYMVEAVDQCPVPVQVFATTSFKDTAQFLLQGCSWHKGDCYQAALPDWAKNGTLMDGWTSGVLKFWSELEYVPYRLRINLPQSGDTGTYYITNEHDNLRNGVTGIDNTTEYYVGKLSDGTLTKTCTPQATRLVGDNPTALKPCIVTGHTYTGINDDPGNDANIDEETTNGNDNDGDNLIDEDPSGSFTPARKIQDTWAVLFNSSEAGSSTSKWALYWKAHLALGSSGFPGASLHANTTATGNQDVPIKNVQPPPAVCGNWILEVGEQCDDGNTISGDGCSSTCQFEIPPPAVCGNGILEGSEQCDDGNNINGDGCSATCQYEPDLFINKSYTGTPNPGKTLSFTIQHGNTGWGNASSVVVTDDYDQNYVYIIPGSICCGGSDNGDEITWNIGTVLAGSGPFSLTYQGKLHDGTPGTTAHMPVGDTHVVNTATITTTSTDFDLSDNIWTVDILVHAEPNLFVTKIVDSGSQIQVKQGDTVTITLTYGNANHNDAPNVTLCDDYNQAYLDPIPATITPGGVDDGDKICWGLTADTLPGVISGTRTLPGTDPQVGYQASVINTPVNWEDPANITTPEEPLSKLSDNTAKVLFNVEKPTAVTLSSFGAQYASEEVIISWRTRSEIDSEGFHIWRGQDINGPYVRITPDLIISKGSAFRGESYRFVDTQIMEQCLQKCYYRLEEIDARGNSTRYGPVVAVAGGIRDQKSYTSLSMDTGNQESALASSGKDPRAGVHDDPDSTDMMVTKGYTSSTAPAYTIGTFADGTANLLTGEGRTRVPGFSLDIEPAQYKPPMNLDTNRNKDVIAGSERHGVISSTEIASVAPRPDVPRPNIPHNDKTDRGSINFRIIDSDGNDVAIASLETMPGDFDEDQKLYSRWDGNRVIITWYVTEPVKGFHILRSTKKDGPYHRITKTPIPYPGTASDVQIFRYTYTDRKILKGERYYYRLETIPNPENVITRLKHTIPTTD